VNANESPSKALVGAIAAEEVTRTLVELIRRPSPNPGGTEADVAAFVADYCRGLGLDVQIVGIAPGRPNVVARLRGRSDGPTVVLNSHLDTVPASSGWTEDPFGGSVHDGRVWGLGACDAKGQIAAMLAALRALVESRPSLAGELVLTAVIDEEAGSIGSRAVARDLGHVDYAVIGEPTRLEVGIAHRGGVRPRIIVEGKAAHSSMPDLGINAIVKMRLIIEGLERYAERVGQRRHPLIGPATASITMISGGRNESAIPDRCELILDRRMVPGESEEAVVAEIEAVLREAAARDPELRVRIDGFRPVSGPASETPRDARLVGLAVEAVEAVTAGARIAGMTFGCDMSHFRAIGAEGVVLGPGDIARCHKPDEYIGIDELVMGAGVYATLVHRLLA
jgi:acetylornithine deacetylase/succinyl-diaminopimelate desuccinylase family protein